MTRFAFALLLLAGCCAPAYASDWQQPTPEELKMTADPKAPGAPAVYLYREEITNDKLNMHSLYVRIKVLTEKGKEYGDVKLPAYEGRTFSITNVAGRTVHPDGTVVPLGEKPITELLLRQGQDRYKSMSFSLPAVEPGSILEYRYTLRYDTNLAVPPAWFIQQPIFVHHAHYHFVPTEHQLVASHDQLVAHLSWTKLLPPGVDMKENPAANYFDLDIDDVPALPDESYMPPLRSASYRVLFFYSPYQNPDEFWKKEGKYWSKDVERFARQSDAMRGAVASLTTPADAPEAKLRKLYNAVMAMENTDFTREHGSAENKAAGLRVKTADDIWAQKRGTGDELNRLFLALARAAGFKAYDMKVVNRDRDVLFVNFMQWNQLDDEIAIVDVGGKEEFFDPGQRYAEFGKLHWKHTFVQGVRETSGDTAIASTPGTTYKDTLIRRQADLQMDEHGTVTGTIVENMSGARALHWRQRALELDEEALRDEYDKQLREELPGSVEAKVDHFVGLADPEHLLMARIKVEGTLGTATGHRVLLPSAFFLTHYGSLFPQADRKSLVDLHYPSLHEDKVILKLPSGMKIESMPEPAKLALPQSAGYATAYSEKEGVYTFQRTFVLANMLFLPKEYAQLRDFYAKMGTKDDEQAVLAPASNASSAPAHPSVQ